MAIKVNGTTVIDNSRNVTDVTLLNYDDTLQSLGTIVTDTTLNTANGNVISTTIGAALTFTFSGSSASKSRTFLLKLFNGGSYTVTWPTSVAWPGGTAPTLTASGADIIVFNTTTNGTVWHAVYNLDVRVPA